MYTRCMKSIRIIQTDIDVGFILEALNLYPEDWGQQKTLTGVEVQDPLKLYTTVNVLQLIMGGIEFDGQYVGDSELCYQTPALYHHLELVQWLRERFHAVRRCAFFEIPVGHKVDRHVDFDSYYLTKDRYHLSITGTYKYTVYNTDGTVDVAIIKPGTLFWFNNKLEHESENTDTVPRIAFIFDVPHDPSNP